MNQTKGNKSTGRFALLLAGLLATSSLSAFAQNRIVKGSVVDANNQEPLMGATIMLDGGKTGAVQILTATSRLQFPKEPSKPQYHI